MECRKCHKEEMVIIIDGTRKALVCKQCGAWQKWIGKDEYNLLLIKGIKVIVKEEVR